MTFRDVGSIVGLTRATLPVNCLPSAAKRASCPSRTPFASFAGRAAVSSRISFRTRVKRAAPRIVCSPFCTLFVPMMPATGATTRISRTRFWAVRRRASDAARRALAASAVCWDVRRSRSAIAPALNSTAFCSAVHFCVSKSLCVARRSASADASAASCSVDSNFARSCPAFTVCPSRTSTDSRMPSLRVRTAIVSIGRRSPEIGRPASMLPRPTL